MVLDSYIISRIRRERELNRERESLVPLKIYVPENHPEPPKVDRKEDTDRGSSEIDFQL